jgi:hypothetical protein
MQTIHRFHPIFAMAEDDWRWEEDNEYQFTEHAKTFHLGPEESRSDFFFGGIGFVDSLFWNDVALLVAKSKGPESEVQASSRARNLFVFLQRGSQYKLYASTYVEKYVMGQDSFQTSLNVF